MLLEKIFKNENWGIFMFKYVSDVSEISHYIISSFVEQKNEAIDATLGNGYDTDFLSKNFKKIYSFDIQKCACDNYLKKKIENVEVINDSHEFFNKYISNNVDCIMYNLGFLPGGDKSITTNYEVSLKSIKNGLEILNAGGIMTICIYRGHDEGKKEEEVILEYMKQLPKSKYGVMYHEFLNRSCTAPVLVVIEKK